MDALARSRITRAQVSLLLELAEPANASDAVVFCYLEDRDPTGRVSYITEGVVARPRRAGSERLSVYIM